RELLDVLPEYYQRHVVLLLNFANAEADLVSVTPVAFTRMSGGSGAIVAVEIDGKISEEAHWNLAKLPIELHRHIENHEAVDAGLVRGKSRVALAEIRIADEGDVKAVSIACVVVERRRDLKEDVLGKVDLRADLPGEQQRVGVGNAPTARDRARPHRIFRVRVVVNELGEVREKVDRYSRRLGSNARKCFPIFVVGGRGCLAAT